MNAHTQHGAITVLCGAIAALCGGCFFGALDGITCESDDNCPTNYFCDLPTDTCTAIGDDASVPNLEVSTLIAPDGTQSLFLEVPREQHVAVQMVVENLGLTDAQDIEVSFSRYHGMKLSAVTVPARIKGGGTGTIDLDVFADRAAKSPLPVDWFLDFSGRQRRGVFNFVFGVLEPD